MQRRQLETIRFEQRGLGFARLPFPRAGLGRRFGDARALAPRFRCRLLLCFNIVAGIEILVGVEFGGA